MGKNWPPRGAPGSVGLPEASRDPFWSHFGTLLEPIWSPREPRKSCSRRGGSTFLIKIACSVRTPPSEALRDRFWRHFGAFLIEFRGPGGPTTAPRVARSAPRAAQEAEKGSERASCFEVALREAPGVDFGASGRRFWSLPGGFRERFWTKFRTIYK